MESLGDLEGGSCARRERGDAGMLLPSTQVGRWG